MVQCMLSISSLCLNTSRVLRHFVKHDLPLEYRRQLVLGIFLKHFQVKDNPLISKLATLAYRHLKDVKSLSLMIFNRFSHCSCKY